MRPGWPHPLAVSDVEDITMSRFWVIMPSALILSCSAATSAIATPGGLNAAGCHNDRKGGTGYHCHRSGGSSESVPRRSVASIGGGGGGAYFANCSAARAAGAAPVRAGSPGYSRKLDRDGDGVGCE